MGGAALAVDPAAVARAVEVLLRGGLVGFPTETVYGLGADADRRAAVQAIFLAKGRPPTHPLIVHIADAGAAESWSREIGASARRLMQCFWPGPLTLILPRTARAHDGLTGGQDSVGLRCPASPWAQALLRAFCEARRDRAAAIAAPSANRYGHISPTSAAHVRDDLGEKPAGAVDYILDGGPCDLGIESTIVQITGARARVLRPGSIGLEALAAALGGAVEQAAPEDEAPRVSGRDARHYAPRKPLELVAPAALEARLAGLTSQSVGVLAPASAKPGVAAWITSSDSPARFAHDLYANLRQLDASVAQRLIVVLPPSGPQWEAIHDRLRRAAAGGAGWVPDAD